LRLGAAIAVGYGFMVSSAGQVLGKVRSGEIWKGNFVDHIFNYTELAFLIFGSISILFYFSYVYVSLRSSAKKTQIDRNDYARFIVDNHGNNGESNFSLYLRPFIFDELIKNKITHGTSDSFTRLTGDHFENLLCLAVDRHHPIVSIGGARAKFGPGGHRIEDADWQTCIKNLMLEAEKIFIVPIAQPSTLWEVQQIVRHGHLQKTFFVVPPLKSVILQKDNVIGRGSTAGDLYFHSHAEMEKLGIALPKLDELGGIFWYHGNNGINWRVRVFATQKTISYRSIRKVIFDDSKSPMGDDEIMFDDFRNIPFEKLRKSKKKVWFR